MKLVVVEGPDGAGKSTLIYRLKQESKRHFVVLHRANPPENVSQIVGATDILSAASFSDVNVVCDRHPFISEPIYGLTLRGKNLLEGLYGHSMLRATLADTVDRVIYCRPPIEVIVENAKNQHQLSGVHERILTLIEAYDEMMGSIRNELGIPVLRYDWTDELSTFGPTYPIERLFFGDVK